MFRIPTTVQGAKAKITLLLAGRADLSSDYRAKLMTREEYINALGDISKALQYNNDLLNQHNQGDNYV